MIDSAVSINKKNSILLSRNKPVALVVGAAGFLGSHLVDKLLEKDIQVVGVDDLASGEKQNLQMAVKDQNFHLIIESPDKLDLDFPRVDYIFIDPGKKWDLEKILEIFRYSKGRCLLISSIDLYGSETHGRLKELKALEGKIAKFASEYNLNARVLRLGPVFGPRMKFGEKDPVIRLIASALTDGLQKDISLEFSSRILYISDAVDLALRTIFAGSTAQRIFDGVNDMPVKVSEVKQVLLDPVWYEKRSFNFSPLPPWSTPNLEKTIKFLNWHPQPLPIEGLRKTLSYFKDNEILVEKQTEEIKEVAVDDQKKGELELFKQGSRKVQKKIKVPLPLAKIYLLFVTALVTYALIWPMIIIGWGIFTFRQNISEGLKNLAAGNFAESLKNISAANSGITEVESIYSSLEPVRKTGLFKDQFEAGDKLINLSLLSVASSNSTVLGMQQLLESLKAITGEKTESPADNFNLAQIELSQALQNLSKAAVLLQDQDFGKGFFKKMEAYHNLVKQAWVISILLPKFTAIEGTKNYLVLLQNNMELRPTGGFIGSFAKVSFEGGKLKKLAVDDVYAIDGQLNIHVEPPKEIKEDLNQKDWFLRDSNFEPDFPTSARQAEWFYAKETGERVEGVIALDVSAMENLLRIAGPLDLPDYSEKITADNLFERAVTHAETGFFPGSQAKKGFLTALTNQLFNKIFFMPQNNWPEIITVLGKSLNEKHISIYLDDPQLFSYLESEGWVHVFPRQAEQNRASDFLSLIEANLGGNKVNYYLDRQYKLETSVGKEGEIKHRMRVSYVNRSPSDVFPGGIYKNRLRVYLPFGTKLIRALWGEADITKNVLSFVDYGRSGYSLLLELAPKEQKTLVLDYTVPVKLEFKEGKATYRLDIIKQAGTLKDPLEWTINYPISYRVVSDQAKIIGPQEQTISTDLSSDRSFEVEFQK